MNYFISANDFCAFVVDETINISILLTGMQRDQELNSFKTEMNAFTLILIRN